MERPSSQREAVRELEDTIEAKQAVIAAEEIALVRMELEDRLLKKTGASVEDWYDVGREVLTEHPALQPYKEFFEQAIAGAKTDASLVRNVWHRARKENINQVKDPLWEGEALSMEADSGTSRELFRYLFNREPAGEVHVERHRTFLFFTLSLEDFAWVNRTDEEIVQTQRIGGLFLRIRDIPIIAEKRGGAIESEERSAMLYHELEHRKNELLRESREVVIHSKSIILVDPKLSLKIQRRDDKELPIEKKTKDELLAHLTVAMSHPSAVELRRKGVAGEDVFHGLFASTEAFDRGLEEALVRGAYYDRHKDSQKLSLKEDERHAANVQKAIVAFRRLRDIYAVKRDAPQDARLALNVLEQFPLYLWPAVERLVGIKH